jgi:hypothetical protein
MSAPAPQTHEPDTVNVAGVLVSFAVLWACIAAAAGASAGLLGRLERGRPPVRSPTGADLAAFPARDQWLHARDLLDRTRADAAPAPAELLGAFRELLGRRAATPRPGPMP